MCLGSALAPFLQLLVVMGAENYTENLLERNRRCKSVSGLLRIWIPGAVETWETLGSDSPVCSNVPETLTGVQCCEGLATTSVRTASSGWAESCSAGVV